MSFSDYPAVVFSVDVVLFTLIERKPAVLVYRRNRADLPFYNCLALPGGLIHTDTDRSLEQACLRILRDKVGYAPDYLEQLQTFAGPARDPRGWAATTVYFSLLSRPIDVTPGETQWLLLDDLSGLAFDHSHIIQVAWQRVCDKARYSALPCLFLPEHFTLGEMQEIYEIIQQRPLDKASFRRKMADLDFLEPVNEYRGGHQRPAQLYALRNAHRPPLFPKTVV